MSIFTWIAKLFRSIKDDAAKVAVAITEGIQTALKAGILTPIADFLDATFKTEIGEEVITFLNGNITKILAVELAVEGLPDNPTPDDITAFASRVSNAIAGKDLTGKSKLWSTLAAQVAGIIETEVNKKESLTFAVLVDAVETAYQDYLADQAANEGTSDDVNSGGDNPPVPPTQP